MFPPALPNTAVAPLNSYSRPCSGSSTSALSHSADDLTQSWPKQSDRSTFNSLLPNSETHLLSSHSPLTRGDGLLLLCEAESWGTACSFGPCWSTALSAGSVLVALKHGEFSPRFTLKRRTRTPSSHHILQLIPCKLPFPVVLTSK